MKVKKEDLLLYAVTDRSWLKEGENLYDQVESALKGGVTFVQLREKKLDKDSFIKEALKIKELCAKYKVPFVINDSVEIALETDADGVHVGQDDMQASNVRELLGPDKIIGVSVHNVAEALEAQRRGADYLGCGACFPTGSKDNVTPLDHEELKRICEAVDIPVAAIGGINKDNILQLSGKGLSGAALISAIFAAEDIEKNAAVLKELCERIAVK